MATYIPGSKSYMPEFKPFTPDYKFLSAVLDTKTNRYNTNYKQLNDLYSKIVYAPLSRNDTQYMRDQYTEGLSDKLEKISGMDLSLIQNVDAAKGVFKPFFETDIIVKDMVMTKTYQNELAHANRLLNDPDPKRNEMYWTEGIKAMEYRMQDFIEANQENALSSPLPKYVPDADLYALSLEILKESGLSVKQDIVTKDGQWIITRENGDLVTGPALEMLKRKLVNNPKVQQAYYTKSFVRGRDYAQQGIEEGRFNNVSEGQREWALKTISEYQAKVEKTKTQQTKELSEKEGSVTSWELFMEKYGIAPGSQQEKAMKKQYGDYMALQQGLERSNEILNNASKPIDQNNVEQVLNKAYNIMMQYDMGEDMIAAARAYGNMKASTTIKMENPEFARQRNFQYDKAMESIRQANRMQLAKFKQDLENKANEGLLSSPSLDVTFGEPGTTSTNYIEDVIADSNNQIENFHNGIQASKVRQILEALPYFQPDKDGKNQFKLFLGGQEVKASIGNQSSTGGNTLFEILMTQEVDENGQPTGKLKYESEIEEYYKIFNGYINPSNTKTGFTSKDEYDNLLSVNPNLALSYDEYITLKSGFSTVDNNSNRLQEIVKKRNDHYKQQYDLAVAGGLDSEYEVVNQFQELAKSGIDLFEKNGDGYNLKTKEQFIAEYVEGAKKGLFKDVLSRASRFTPFGEDSGHDWNYRKKANVTIYGNQQPQIDPNKEFSENEAMKDAAMLYDIMYNMLNNTQNGTYTGEAEQIKQAIEDGTDISQVIPTSNQNVFSTFDVNRALMGRQPIGPLGEIISSPTYSYSVNPLNINQDLTAASLVSDIIRQLNTSTNQTMTIQKGVLAKLEDAVLNAPNDEIAQKLLQEYLRQMKAFSTNPKSMSKSNLPLATIKYNPTYNTPDNPSGEYAAYEINFSPEWVREQLTYLTTGGQDGQTIKASDAAQYETITFAFNGASDVSVRRDDAYNFSNVMSQINLSDNGQYVNNIAGGGIVRVNQNIDGQYMAHVKFLQYDPSIGDFKILPEKKYNLNDFIQQQTGSQDVMSYLDQAVRYMEILVEEKMKLNSKLLKESNATSKK